MGILHEEWLPVSRAGNYEVSNLGNVRRSAPDKFGRKPVNLSASPDRHGNLFVTMTAGRRSGAKTIRAAVNRLVYAAFIGEIPEYKWVRHSDGNQANCSADNLVLIERPFREDFTGRTCGYWTVVEYIGFNHRGYLWKCRCVCGTERTLKVHHLKYGCSKSCGCKSNELTADKISGSNHYSWKGGIRNSGSLAWCNGRLSSLREGQKKHGGAKIKSTAEDVQSLWEQCGGRCMACGRKPRTGKPLHLDHNNKTGRVRGFVCGTCNVAIGMAGDSSKRLRDLADYIDLRLFGVGHKKSA